VDVWFSINDWDCFIMYNCNWWFYNFICLLISQWSRLTTAWNCVIFMAVNLCLIIIHKLQSILGFYLKNWFRSVTFSSMNVLFLLSIKPWCLCNLFHACVVRSCFFAFDFIKPFSISINPNSHFSLLWYIPSVSWFHG